MSYMKTQIINEAMEKAAQSINMIVGCEAKVVKIDFSFPNIDGSIQYTNKTDQATHVLKTTIAGNLSGASYLILSPEDVNKIHLKCLPEEVVKTDNVKNKALKGALLLEIDNIVSASTVTIFANHMDQMIYGDVPKLMVLNSNQVNSFLTSEIENSGCPNCLNVMLQVDDLDIALDFFWVFEDSFFEQLLENKVEVA